MRERERERVEEGDSLGLAARKGTRLAANVGHKFLLRQQPQHLQVMHVVLDVEVDLSVRTLANQRRHVVPVEYTHGKVKRTKKRKTVRLSFFHHLASSLALFLVS